MAAKKAQDVGNVAGDYAGNRAFMRSSLDDRDIVASADIAKGISQPPMEKPRAPDAYVMPLPEVSGPNAPKANLFECISGRCSRRAYTGGDLSVWELAFLLWCTQGIRRIVPGHTRYMTGGKNALRTVPSGGSTNPYETYLAINHLRDTEPGVWRYLPTSHQLLQVRLDENLEAELPRIFSNPSQNQDFVSRAAVVFFWACTPYRGEWRYQHTAHKLMMLDAGHICQNLYLAAEAIDCGCCAIGAYYQSRADAFIGVDGMEEYTVYCASVGRIKKATA